MRTIKHEDFIGFTFNRRHSSEFGLKIVSNSNRFQEKVGPDFKDATEQIPGGDGQYYWQSNGQKKEWTLNVAFDDVSEVEMRQMRQWLNHKVLGELIFDELPYKAYKVKLSKAPDFKYLCFDEEVGSNNTPSALIHNHMLAPSTETPAQETRQVRRVYKGEATLNFVSYQIYASTVYKNLETYELLGFRNVSEWAESSGLLNSSAYPTWHRYPSSGALQYRYCYLYNPGDIESDWSMVLPCEVNTTTTVTIELRKLVNDTRETINSLAITLPTLGAQSAPKTYNIQFDSATQLVTCLDNMSRPIGQYWNKQLTSDGWFKIPVTTDTSLYNIRILNAPDNVTQFDYKFLYY